MLLPFGCGHHRSDCCACRGTQQGNDMGVLGAGPGIRRTTSAPPGQITRQGKTPKRASSAPSHHSNAPIRQESQSILSKIVARRPRREVLAAVKAASQTAATSVVAIDVESDPVRSGLAASLETPDRLGFPEAKTILTT